MLKVMGELVGDKDKLGMEEPSVRTKKMQEVVGERERGGRERGERERGQLKGLGLVVEPVLETGTGPRNRPCGS